MFELKLNEQELNIVAAALGHLPYAQVAPLIENIKSQVAQQQQKPKAEEAPND